MEKTEKNLVQLSFLTRGLGYLKLVSNVLEENTKQGNMHMPVFENIDENELWSLYDEKTKWSDFRIIEPTLFNFYHGLELTMKGLLFLLDGTVEINHGLKIFYMKLKSKDDIPNSIKTILEKHFDDSKLDLLILEFLTENHLDIDRLYEVLRYPTGKSFDNVINYIRLHYQEEKSLAYFSQIISDIDQLSREVVKFYRGREA